MKKKQTKEKTKVKTMPLKKAIEQSIAQDLPIPNSRKIAKCENDNSDILSKLKNHRGRFVSILVNRSKTGETSYCAKIKNITDKMLFFTDMNLKQNVSVMLSSVIGVS